MAESVFICIIWIFCGQWNLETFIAYLCKGVKYGYITFVRFTLLASIDKELYHIGFGEAYFGFSTYAVVVPYMYYCEVLNAFIHKLLWMVSFVHSVSSRHFIFIQITNHINRFLVFRCRCIGFTSAYVKVVCLVLAFWIYLLYLRQCIALFAVAKGRLFLDIGWFVLFLLS